MLKPKLSIIITTSNNSQILSNCLNSIQENPPTYTYEVIIVDNGSSDDTVNVVESHPLHCLVIKSSVNLKFSRGNNLGAENSKGEYLLLLNDDTIVLPKVFDQLIDFMETNTDVGIVGPKLLNADGTHQKSYFDFPTAFKNFLHLTGISFIISRIQEDLTNWRPLNQVLSRYAYFRVIDEPIPVDYVIGACMLIRRSALINQNEVLDSSLEFYHEDCEIGFRMKKLGFKVFYYPHVEIIHLGGSSKVLASVERFVHHYRSELIVFKKHKSFIEFYLLKITIILASFIRILALPLSGWGIYLPTRYNKGTNTNKYNFFNLVVAGKAFSRLIFLSWLA